MTKIITIIIIVSTVWSVISGIIEKHKKDKLASQKRILGNNPEQGPASLRVSSPQPTAFEKFEARIEHLRQRPQQRVIAPVQNIEKSSKKSHRTEIKKIKTLHVEECPLQPTTGTVPKGYFKPTPRSRIHQKGSSFERTPTQTSFYEIIISIREERGTFAEDRYTSRQFTTNTHRRT